MSEQKSKNFFGPFRSLITGINRLAARWIALPFLRLYHFVFSPIFSLLGSQCRFYPSCSHYAEEAYRVHGFARGTLLTTVRVAKCNPLHPGGIDPVPGSPLEAELKLEVTQDTHPHSDNNTNSPTSKYVAANHSG